MLSPEEILRHMQNIVKDTPPLDYLPYTGCEREIIYQEGGVTLYRYHALAAIKIATPVLMVFALVNRPTILDLQPNTSMIKQLLLSGLDLYLIDWGYPVKEDATLTLQNYLTDFLKRAVDHICQQHQLEKINLLGICQGGVLSLCYAALSPNQIKNLITMVTPVDFHTSDNRIRHLIRHIDIDLLIKKFGNLPGHLLGYFFISLKPYQLTLGKNLLLMRIKDKPDELRRFLEVERWLYDNPDQAGNMLQQFTAEFYQQNNLIRGLIKVGRRMINLKKINMPVLNIMARHDHIVPLSASERLIDFISSKDYTAHVFDSGHIGIYITQQSLCEIPTVISQWLMQRE